jgi:CRISPR system Cascade subunit CasC
MPARFLEIHFLTSWPASLLNRDDAGFAKRMPFGGATRTRVSSQCLKRHWRTHDGPEGLAALGEPGSVRSRVSFEKLVLEPLVKEGVAEDVAQHVVAGLMAIVLGKSEKRKKAEEEGAAATDEGEEPAGAKPQSSGPAKRKAEKDKSISVRTEQVTVLGRPELDFLLSEARAICKELPQIGKKEAERAINERVETRFGKKSDARKNLEKMRLAAGLDAALFGRMVTSDILARGNAAVHVAHAFTVHAEQSESDYFSVVDELLRESETESLGSGGIFSTELTSGLFYGYVVVDVPLLVSNLEGCVRKDWLKADRALAGRVAATMARLVANVSPGAKLGSTAPYSRPHLLFVEGGDSQPRTLANAFLRPVAEQPDLMGNAYAALASHLSELDAAYGGRPKRAFVALGPAERLTPPLDAGSRTNLDGLAKRVASWIAEE